MTDYPVDVEVASPARFDRVQVAIRVVLAIALGWLGITAGWVAWVLYLLLPIVAAVTLTSHPSEYPTGIGARIWRALEWLLAFSAYMMFLVDRFPVAEDHHVRIQLEITGKPTIGSALARLVTSIPSGIVLTMLWVVSGVVWLLTAIFVLATTRIPEGILAFQRAVLRWDARLAAYHASLVDEYPPFALDTGPRPGTPAVPAEHPAG